MTTINMQDMRYLNLFEKITGVRTRFCLKYNNMIMFSIPRSFIPKAMGDKGANLQKISQVIKKRIRILAAPNGVEDAEKFLKAIVNPAEFNSLEVKEGVLVINAGSTQNKAALFGRNKTRFEDMKVIVKDFFGLDYRIN